jgi:hypothetical protein
MKYAAAAFENPLLLTNTPKSAAKLALACEGEDNRDNVPSNCCK